MNGCMCSGKAGPDHKSYAVDLELFDEIDPDVSRSNRSFDRNCVTFQ